MEESLKSGQKYIVKSLLANSEHISKCKCINVFKNTYELQWGFNKLVSKDYFHRNFLVMEVIKKENLFKRFWNWLNYKN